MKNRMRFFAVILVLSVFALTANAQLFVGGGLGMNFSGPKTAKEVREEGEPNDLVTKGTSSFNFWLSPEVGYRLNENLLFGATVNFSYGLSKEWEEEKEGGLLEKGTTSSVSTISFGLTPFAEWAPVTVGKLSLFLRGELPVNYTLLPTSKLVVELPESTVSSETDVDGGGWNLGLRVLPGLSFALNDNISLFTRLNFLSLGFNYFIKPEFEEVSNNKKRVTTTSGSEFNFNFGVDEKSVSTVEVVTLGARIIF